MSQNNGRGFFGIVIPIKVLNNRELTISEKFVYAYVVSYAKYCMDGNAKIADRLGVSEPTVTRALASLQKRGYVAIDYANNNNAKRRIRDIYGKAQQKQIIVKNDTRTNRGQRQSFPQSFPQLLAKMESNQNDEMSNQNDYTRNGGESNQNDYHRIIRIKRRRENRTGTELDNTPAGLAGEGPASRLDLNDQLEFEDAFYKNNTMYLGAI